MTTSKRQIQQGLQNRFAEKANRTRYQSAILGHPDGTVYIADRPGYVWARLGGQNGQIIQLYARGLLAGFNMPVIIQRLAHRPNDFGIVDLDLNAWPSNESGDTPGGWDGGSYIGMHGSQHWYYGGDAVLVHLRAWTPLRVYVAGGLSIGVMPGIIPRGGADLNIVQQVISLINSVPAVAGQQRYTLITLDAAGALSTTDGTAVSGLQALSLANIPDTPAGHFRLAAVRLYNGQTVLAETASGTDLVDLRWPQERIAGSTTVALTDIPLTEDHVLVGNASNVASDVALTSLIMRDTRANQPAAGIPGRLYRVTDEGVTERDTGSTWENYGTDGGGAVGGTTGATDNAVLRADGTGGATAQSSLMTVDDAGSPNIPTGQTYKINGTAHTHAGIGATPNRDYFVYLAARLEPLALEAAQVSTFTYSLTAGTPKILIASFNTKLGATGRMESRNPAHPLILNTGLTLAGLDTDSSAILLDPSAPTYTDAEATYYERLNRLASEAALAQKVLAFSGAQTLLFLPGPYGSLITQVTSFDYNWIVAIVSHGEGWNLWDEIGDSTIQRIGDGLIVPVSKLTISKMQSSGSGSGAVVYVILPADWGAVADGNTYDFRDDFMGATLDTATVWTRAQSTAGNVEIDTTWQWCKWIGNTNWGQNSAYSQASIARAAGKVFECDVVFTANGANDGGMVGFSDGAGQSYTNLAHAINFNNNALTVYENGTSRGAVGSTFTINTIYRVRITLTGADAATYEIQGGSQYAALGGATWTDITPGTSSSATATLHAGFAAFGNTNYISDVKLY